VQGPIEDELYQDSEYSPFVESSIYEARPDLHKEIGYFKEPRNGRKIDTDSLLAFVEFAPSAAEGGGGRELVASIAFDDGSIVIVDRGEVLNIHHNWRFMYIYYIYKCQLKPQSRRAKERS